MKKEKVQFYEIVEGNIVNDRQYTGIILRDERVESTDRAGYINYYIREGKRAAIGTRIYSIDETGNMAELMQEKSVSSASPFRSWARVFRMRRSVFSAIEPDSLS